MNLRRQSLGTYADVSVHYSCVSPLSLVNFGIPTNDLYALGMSSVGFGAASHHGLHVDDPKTS